MSTPPWTLAGYSDGPVTTPTTGVNRIAWHEPLRLPSRTAGWMFWYTRVPNHGPWHRDTKHVARLVYVHHTRAMARLVARPDDAVHESPAASGTVHEGVVVT